MPGLSQDPGLAAAKTSLINMMRLTVITTDKGSSLMLEEGEAGSLLVS